MLVQNYNGKSAGKYSMVQEKACYVQYTNMLVKVQEYACNGAEKTGDCEGICWKWHMNMLLMV